MNVRNVKEIGMSEATDRNPRVTGKREKQRQRDRETQREGESCPCPRYLNRRRIHSDLLHWVPLCKGSHRQPDQAPQNLMGA